MTKKMDDDPRQNTGNLSEANQTGRGALPTQRRARDRGGTRRHEPPDERLDRAMRDVYIALKANEGRGPYASRRIANAAHGITKPHRPLARLIRDARRAKCLTEIVDQITKVLNEAAGTERQRHSAA